MLAIFNLISAFPLDGGRVFRAILWAKLKDIRKATRIASNSGKIFGSILIAFGILLFPSGIWFIFIGIFLIFLAESGYKKVLIKLALDNVNIKELVKQRSLLNSDMNLYEFLQWCTENGVSEGIVEKDGIYYIVDLNSIPKMKKNNEIPNISSIMIKTTPVSINDKPLNVLRDMQNSKINITPVIENNNYIGIISMDSIFRLIKIKSLQDSKSKMPLDVN